MSELKTNLEAILQEKQTKILPENIKKDIQIFDVIGTLESSGTTSAGVKLFKTEEEMQAEPSAKEGDLAIVYRNEIQNMTAETQTQYITFPETVTLPEAFADSVYTMLRAVDSSAMFDGQVMLDANMFRFDGYSETGMIRVSYSSSDGITYTRDEFMGDNGDLTNPVDLGTNVKCYYTEEWNAAFGYFMQIGGMNFGGLYEYDTKLDTDALYGKVFSDDNKTFLIPKFNKKVSGAYWIEILEYNDTIIPNQFYITKCNIFETVAGTLPPTYSALGIDNLGVYYYLYTEDGDITKYVYDFTKEDSLVETIILTADDIALLPKVNNHSILAKCDYALMLSVDAYNINKIFPYYYGWHEEGVPKYNVDTDTVEELTTDRVFNYPNVSKYRYANTQYTLTSANQLLPNVSAYGKNGSIIGNGSIYDNLDIAEIFKRFYNCNETLTNSYATNTSIIASPLTDVGKVHYLKQNNSRYVFCRKRTM